VPNELFGEQDPPEITEYGAKVSEDFVTINLNGPPQVGVKALKLERQAAALISVIRYRVISSAVVPQEVVNFVPAVQCPKDSERFSRRAWLAGPRVRWID
jgi:hypothetical protein